MNLRALTIGLGVAAVAGMVGLRLMSTSAEAAPANAGGPSAPIDPNATPVLVELFTSEGCSSCPSADAALARLSRSQPVANVRVIVLAHHVDYWNQLGWPDPFSSSAATARQRTYAPLSSGSYTPQAVIDGRTEMVGSRGPAIELAAQAHAKQTHAKIDIELSAAKEKSSFDVTLRSRALPADAHDDAEVLLAVVQDRGRVAVPRGENSGKTLDHVGIARSLRVVGSVPKAGASLKTSITVPSAISAPPDGSTFSIVAFVQERSSRHILGTSTIAVP